MPDGGSEVRPHGCGLISRAPLNDRIVQNIRVLGSSQLLPSCAEECEQVAIPLEPICSEVAISGHGNTDIEAMLARQRGAATLSLSHGNRAVFLACDSQQRVRRPHPGA
jgi:hypothetical protein